MLGLSIMDVKYVKPLKVEIRFSDGLVRVVDVGAFIKAHPHPQYNSYLDEKKFKNFKLDMGNLVWGKNWDLIFSINDLHNGKLTT